eukprot:GFYU01002055.1.p1 GENE.GFYU01002055.1~~GFYU01002055.1.p1  ORF type:complete len:359 (+),score=36.09 GFYU01002055.1:47-1123(+)
MRINHSQLQNADLDAHSPRDSNSAESAGVTSGFNRCRRCGQPYDSSAPSTCSYHTGVVKSTNILPHLYWSCCREMPDAVGCHQGVHTPCPDTSRVLAQFDATYGTALWEAARSEATSSEGRTSDNENSASDVNMRCEDDDTTSTSDSDSDNDSHESEAEAESEPQPVEYLVQSQDTLAGIALKFGVKLDELKRENRLTQGSHTYIPRKTLVIPNPSRVVSTDERATDTVDRNSPLEKFKRETFCDDTEAREYLDRHHWDVKAAIAAFDKDIFEETTQNQQKLLEKLTGVTATVSPDRKRLIQDGTTSHMGETRNGGSKCSPYSSCLRDALKSMRRSKAVTSQERPDMCMHVQELQIRS